MKKLLTIIATMLITISIYGCQSRERLYVLNWGDYMDESLVEEFENEFNVRVKYKSVGSNEEMASLLKAENAVYDLVFPSDYMIDKFVSEELIQPIDFDQLTNFEGLSINATLADLYEDYGFGDYVVPYAWGTIGIMYRTDIDGLEALLQAEEWDVLFEYGDTYRTGMYDSPRDAVASALLYLGYSVNSEDETELSQAEAALTNANFYAWGEDNLKGRVIANTLDLALVYSGDYFSEYYSAIEDEREINFGFYVPNSTNVWMDAIVIPSIANNVPLAHQFIDFLLREDVALTNYEYIGYAPPYDLIYNQIYTEIENDFGGLAANFDPFPEGTYREMYVYGSDERSDLIVNILQRAKASD